MVKAKKVLLVFSLGYLIVVAGYYLLQERFFFLPETLSIDYKYEFEQPFEELFFEPEEGIKINYLHFKTQNSKGNIIYFHGNADNLARWGNEASYLCRFGYDVWAIDYRTFGKSTGELSEKSLYADAEKFYQEVENKFPLKNTVIFGRSLGCTFASFIAAKHNPNLLVLEAPFYSLTDVLKLRFPFLPHQKILNYQFPSFQFADSITCKTIIFHGNQDQTIPKLQGKKLFEVITSQNKEFVVLEGAGHKNQLDFPKYTETLERVLK